jgi:nitrite transporter NirC
MGVSFGIALSLVIFAGSELFTGNNMVMTIGLLAKKISLNELNKVWFYSFIGNFAGSVILAFLVAMSGLATNNPSNELIVKISSLKMTAPFIELFIRGILCNILVCLAVWISIKAKSETAKLIMIFWCLFAFISSGYEHSIANMSLLSLALMIPHPESVSLIGLFNNLIPVTLGNIVGGAVFVGMAYWFSSLKINQKIEVKDLQLEEETA